MSHCGVLYRCKRRASARPCLTAENSGGHSVMPARHNPQIDNIYFGHPADGTRKIGAPVQPYRRSRLYRAVPPFWRDPDMIAEAPAFTSRETRL